MNIGKALPPAAWTLPVRPRITAVAKPLFTGTMAKRGLATTSEVKPPSVRRLDFSGFLNGDEKKQAQFCGDLVDALCTEGFVKLRNHGIDQESIDKVFAWNKRFFDLPLEAKNVAAHPEQPNPHRGYSYIGQEKLSRVKDFEKGVRDSVQVHDIKESYDQGPPNDEMYPNRWPEDKVIPGFRPFMESFYDKCHNVHLNLLRALGTGLGLGPARLESLCNVNTSELRLNHYPACATSQIRAGAMRISEHTDFGTVTLLFQDSQGGLEIEDQKNPGSYFPIMPEGKYEMIINIGDCLQLWTNKRLRSTSHRVVTPPIAGHWLPSRYSVAYFAKPNRDQSVAPLPELLKDGETSQYKDITAWEYNQQKLTRTY
uniref:2-oxoglutarate/Fe(II)-dependent dioxygenase n=1 Tax=Emericellopsis sp. TaxID=88752 RepID=A0AA96NNI3_9HYPO|nr:putative 2-oxoglutarate/Fe(II)-dependent dioxygenase [Emericellopsis sp.]